METDTNKKMETNIDMEININMETNINRETVKQGHRETGKHKKH